MKDMGQLSRDMTVFVSAGEKFSDGLGGTGAQQNGGHSRTQARPSPAAPEQTANETS